MANSSTIGEDDDNEAILSSIRSLLGTRNVQVVEMEKTCSVQEEEVLLINGVPVSLEGIEDGSDGGTATSVRAALRSGQIPPLDALQQVLMRAGIFHPNASVQLETSLSVRRDQRTTEDVSVSQNGRLIDSRSYETTVNNYYASTSKETFDPVVTSAPPQTTARKLTGSKAGAAVVATASPGNAPIGGGGGGGPHSVVSCDSGHHDGDDDATVTAVTDSSYSLQTTDSCLEDHHISPPPPNPLTTAMTSSSLLCGKEKDHAHSQCQCHHHRRHRSCSNQSHSNNGGSTVFYGKPQTATTMPMQASSLYYTTLPHPSEIDADECLFYRDGGELLTSATLPGLMRHMTPTSDYYPDRSFLFAFLLSARLFISPHELLQNVCDLCHRQQKLDRHLVSGGGGGGSNAGGGHNATTNLHQQQQSVIRFTHNFVSLLADWMEMFPYDFRDERMMQSIRTMTQKCIAIAADDSGHDGDGGGKVRSRVSSMLQNLLQRLKALERYEEFLIAEEYAASGAPGDDVVDGVAIDDEHHHHNHHHHHHNHHQLMNASSCGSSSSSSLGGNGQGCTIPTLSELCPSSAVMAQQLTHIELERLSYVGPEEFVQEFARSRDRHIPGNRGEPPPAASGAATAAPVKKTRNLESYIRWFNRLTSLVASDILRHRKKRHRAPAIEYWIETARESFNIGNFNSLMAIIGGLNSAPIMRLKKTWAKIQSASGKFSILERQMDPSNNFSSYRSTLKAAQWRASERAQTDPRQRIVVPFFSLLVKDLHFLNEGCSNRLPNGRINFEKFWPVAGRVREFVGWQRVTAPFEKNRRVLMALQTGAPVFNESTASLISYEREPPDSATERERYRALKQELQQQQRQQKAAAAAAAAGGATRSNSGSNAGH